MTDRANLMRVALQTLTFQAIPALRLIPRGLLHVKSQQFVPVLL